jgi:hypothetical protein
MKLPGRRFYVKRRADFAVGFAEKLLLHIPHFRHPWRSAEKLLLCFRHSRHPWRSQAKEGVWEVGRVPTFAFLGLE